MFIGLLQQGFVVLKKELGLVCWTGHFWMSQGKPKTELCSCSCRKYVPLDEIAMSNVRLEVYHEAFVGILYGSGLTWGPYTPQMCMNVFYRQCSSKKVCTGQIFLSVRMQNCTTM